jgi:hypothetical protein
MPEILTESFCERCGTRYTFESAAPKVKLKGLKVMSRGLRNFVLSDDSSMDEAMAAARNETDREQTSQQLDAFHKTFNFCMNCRQYTCGNCWNEAEGRCLSCAPSQGQEVMPAQFGNMGAGGAMTLSDSEAIGLHEHNGHDAPAPTAPPMAWPTSDLMREADVADAPPWTEAPTEPAWTQAPVEEVAPPLDETLRAEEPAAVADDFEPFDFAARLEALSGPLAAAEPAVEEAISEPEAVEPAAVAEPEAPVASAAAVPPAAVPPAPTTFEEVLDDRAAAAASKTSDLLQRFRPGQSLDDEIEAFERAQAASLEPVVAHEPPVAPPVVEPEPVVAQAPAFVEPEPVAPLAAEPESIYPEPEPEPVETFAPAERIAAAPEREPEPIAAAAAPEPEPEPRIDYVPQPTWDTFAPDAPTSEGFPPPPVQQPAQPPADAVAASGEPQWPSTPQWPDRNAAAGLPFLGRPVAPSGGIEALWAASAQEVAHVGPTPAAKPVGGVQPCVSCGLSLSANARFCRRCGTRQG